MIRFCDLTSSAQGLLAIWIFLISMLFVFLLLRSWQQHHSVRLLLPTAFLFFVCDFFCHILVSNIRQIESGRRVNFSGQLPAACFAAIFLLLSALAGVMLRRNNRWNRDHISEISLKETLDTLPVGICAYYENGMTRLVNLRMSALCQQLTGKTLQNGALFWSCLCQGQLADGCIPLRTENEPIIQTPEGLVYSFSRYESEMDGQRIYELLAADITEEYRNTEQLRRTNEDLERFNARLRRHGETVTGVTREREILAANISIHDKMNLLLLTTQHCLTDECSEEEWKRMFGLWHGNVLLLCRDGGKNDEANPLAELREAADFIGVRLAFEGRLPESNEEKLLVMQAAGECLTNAARHAGATALCIRCSENSVEFTNNGSVPEGDIREGGGLSSIRRDVEKLGGQMCVESVPVYRLIIHFSSKGEPTA